MAFTVADVLTSVTGSPRHSLNCASTSRRTTCASTWSWSGCIVMLPSWPDETAAVLDQRHPRRLLPPRGRAPPGRRVDALLDRRDGTSRCLAVRPGDLRDDAVGVAAAGLGLVAGVDGRAGGPVRRGHRQDEEVRRVEHAGRGGLERPAGPRRCGTSGPAAQAG